VLLRRWGPEALEIPQRRERRLGWNQPQRGAQKEAWTAGRGWPGTEAGIGLEITE
jgi:hypothetical protein